MYNLKIAEVYYVFTGFNSKFSNINNQNYNYVKAIKVEQNNLDEVNTTFFIKKHKSKDLKSFINVQ